MADFDSRPQPGNLMQGRDKISIVSPRGLTRRFTLYGLPGLLCKSELLVDFSGPEQHMKMAGRGKWMNRSVREKSTNSRYFRLQQKSKYRVDLGFFPYKGQKLRGGEAPVGDLTGGTAVVLDVFTTAPLFSSRNWSKKNPA